MQVKEKNGHIWIDGIRGFSPSEYASSVHGSQARILEAVDETLTYEDLICYSGFAFRVGLSDRMCPSAGHPCCGYDCMGPGVPALPWKMEIFESFPWAEPKADRAAFESAVNQAVRESIDRGIPVHYGGEEDGLIIGYADEGRRWWCVHPYHKWGTEPFWHDEAEGFAGGKWPWAVVTWEEPRSEEERISHTDLLVSALKQAVHMWSADKQEDQYYCGGEAYDKWIEWLEGIDAGTVEDPKAGMQGNGWCYDVLIHSRKIAAQWLKTKAENIVPIAAEQLRKAADNYRQLAEILMEGIDCPWSLALPPQKFDEWTEAMRRDQSKRLIAARDLDRGAILAIGEAIELME